MGTGSLSSLGMSALTASYAQLQTTGHNIANVNTAGYSRQEAQLQTAGGQFTGAGFFGRGVDVSTVGRAHDEFLTREAALSRSQAASDSARSDQLQRLENVFGTGENGLGYSAAQFFSAFADVATRPQDESARQVALSQAGQLVSRFNAAADQIDSLQNGVTQDLKASVSQVNVLTQRIAALNQRISDARGLGQPPNDLLDQRELAVSELSQYVQVSTIEADDGSLSVFMGGGQSIVLGAQTTALVAMADRYDSSRVMIGISGPGGDQALPTSLLQGGSISGLVAFQSKDLADARNLLGQLALAVGQQVNDQQALGLDLLNQPGAAMFRFGVASGQPVLTARSSSTNTGTGSVSMTLQSPAALDAAQVSGVQASDYELRADGVGGFELLRLSGGAVDPQYPPQAVADGDVVDGFQISISGTPAAGDRFLLQPAGSAARDIHLDLTNPKLIAAASPLSATTGLSNRGTGSVSALVAGSAAAGSNPNLPATLSFQATATPGQFTYTWQDGTGTSAAVAWQPGQAINYPGSTATDGYTITISGAPVAGDSYTVGRNLYPQSDNRNANAMLSLRDSPLVGAVWTGAGLQPGTNVTEAYANILGNAPRPRQRCRPRSPTTPKATVRARPGSTSTKRPRG
jgi:flagellar hook-associated protein 1 FlgK